VLRMRPRTDLTRVRMPVTTLLSSVADSPGRGYILSCRVLSVLVPGNKSRKLPRWCFTRRLVTGGDSLTF
jgi:hypothetical protein